MCKTTALRFKSVLAISLVMCSMTQPAHSLEADTGRNISSYWNPERALKSIMIWSASLQRNGSGNGIYFARDLIRFTEDASQGRVTGAVFTARCGYGSAVAMNKWTPARDPSGISHMKGIIWGSNASPDFCSLGKPNFQAEIDRRTRIAQKFVDRASAAEKSLLTGFSIIVNYKLNEVSGAFREIALLRTAYRKDLAEFRKLCNLNNDNNNQRFCYQAQERFFANTAKQQAADSRLAQQMNDAKNILILIDNKLPS